jgi:hypothetical protein
MSSAALFHARRTMLGPLAYSQEHFGKEKVKEDELQKLHSRT